MTGYTPIMTELGNGYSLSELDPFQPLSEDQRNTRVCFLSELAWSDVDCGGWMPLSRVMDRIAEYLDAE
jgi:hypothetical protein